MSNVAAADQLKAFFDRIERLTDEKAHVQEHIKDVYAEAKAAGFDTKVMRAVARLRRPGLWDLGLATRVAGFGVPFALSGAWRDGPCDMSRPSISIYAIPRLLSKQNNPDVAVG